MCCLRSAAFAETSGTYVNLEGRWQSFKRCRNARWPVAAGMEDPARARAICLI